MRMLVISPQPFFTPRGTPFSVYYRALVMAEQGVEIDLLTYGAGEDVDIPGVRIVRIPRVRFLEPIPVGPSGKKIVLDMLMFLWTVGMLLKRRYSRRACARGVGLLVSLLEAAVSLPADLRHALEPAAAIDELQIHEVAVPDRCVQVARGQRAARGRCGHHDLPGSARLRAQHRLVRRPALADRELDLRRRPPEEEGRSDVRRCERPNVRSAVPRRSLCGYVRGLPGDRRARARVCYRRGQAHRCAFVARGRDRGAGAPRARARDGASG